MVYVGQAMWDDIKILGHLVCPFVCMSVCVYVVGRYQKFDGVPHKKYCVYLKLRDPTRSTAQVLCHCCGGRVHQALARVGHGGLRQGNWPGVHRRHQARSQQLPLHSTSRFDQFARDCYKCCKSPGFSGRRTRQVERRTSGMRWPQLCQ